MKKHEPKYIEVEGIMRACYDSFLKTGNKAYSEIIALADAVPAADVQEVRHGRWIEADDDGMMHKCSVCGEWSCCRSPYCGECGAKMRSIDDEVADLPMEAYYNKDWKTDEEEE